MAFPGREVLRATCRAISPLLVTGLLAGTSFLTALTAIPGPADAAPVSAVLSMADVEPSPTDPANGDNPVVPVASNPVGDKYVQYANYYTKKANEALENAKKYPVGSNQYNVYYKIYLGFRSRFDLSMAKARQYGSTLKPRGFLNDGFASGKKGNTVNVNSQTGFDEAIANAGPGDVITVADGSYTFPAIKVSGTPTSPITIKAARSARQGGGARIVGIAEIKGSDLIVDGFLFESSAREFQVAYLYKVNNVVLSNNVVRERGAGYGFRIHNSSNIVVDGNLFEGQFNHAVSSKELIHGMKVTNNLFIDCGLGCVEAGQTPDGTLDVEQTSTNIEITGNQFEGRDTKGLLGYRGIGIKVKNVTHALVRNNSFSGNWAYPVQTSFGSVGPKNKSRLGHFGSNHPREILFERNDFGNTGLLDLGGRGRAGDTFKFTANKGAVGCRILPFATHGGQITTLIDWSTIFRGPPIVLQSGNSFRCS